MESTFKDFYDILLENLESYNGEYASFIDYGPLMFKLLTEFLNHEGLKTELKLKICAAIAYYVAPNDVIPESVYGPYGYIDDIFITTYIIKMLSDVYGYDILNGYWYGDVELEKIVNKSYERSKEVLENKTDEVLKYVGLL